MKEYLNVLFIEDDTIERMKFERALKSINTIHNIIEAKNGEEALYILSNNTIIPDIILLDLNMPRMNGLDFLKQIKEHTNYQHIPIIILTTSKNKKDLLSCFKIGISGYISKPLRYGDYVKNIESIFNYWCINELI